MNIEEVPVEVWSDVISGKINFDYKFLALKILLSRLRLSMNGNKSTEVPQEAVAELKTFFTKCVNIPTCKLDLEKIVNSR